MSMVMFFSADARSLTRSMSRSFSRSIARVAACIARRRPRSVAVVVASSSVASSSVVVHRRRRPASIAHRSRRSRRASFASVARPRDRSIRARSVVRRARVAPLARPRASSRVATCRSTNGCGTTERDARCADADAREVRRATRSNAGDDTG